MVTSVEKLHYMTPSCISKTPSLLRRSEVIAIYYPTKAKCILLLRSRLQV